MFYQSLHVARGLAALLVVLFHLGGSFAADKYFNIRVFENIFSWGGEAGVYFFFVLSGFIIFVAHVEDLSRPERLSRYFFKRFVRVYPTYWVVLSIVLLGAATSQSWRQGIPDKMGTWFATLLILPQDGNVVGGTGAPLLPVAWSLQYEIMFYFFFGTLILSRWFAAFWAAIVIAILVGANHRVFPYSFITNEVVLLFLFGMAVARIRGVKIHRRFLPSLSITLGLVLLIAAFNLEPTQSARNARILVCGVAFSCIIWSVIQLERLKAFRFHCPPNLFLQIGDASYVMYLIHFPLISFCCKASMRAGLNTLGVPGALAAFLGIFLAIIWVSILFHSLIEKPVVNWTRKLLSRKA